MVEPKTIRIPGNGGVRVREAEYAGAPMHVSDDANIRNVSTPKSARKFQPSHKVYASLRDRPSTSGGVSNRKPIDKRGTKDDLHATSLPVNHFNTTYYFPLPGPLPTAAATSSSSSSRTCSPENSGPEVESDFTHSPTVIGMALGSPTQQPTVWSPTQQQSVWSPQAQYQALSEEDASESLEEWKTSAQYAKPKTSKWKILGGLFGKKTPESSVDFYQVQTGVQTTCELTCVTPRPIEAPRSRARANSERKIAKHRPEVPRANKMSTDLDLEELERPAVPPKASEPQILQDMRTPDIRLDGGPLLNVDIPSVEMERYSVMFGSLIKPSTSASSLLARRQATLDRLKVVNEMIAEHERQEAEAKSKLLRPRRVTSPQPTRSPSISLFPTTSRTQDGFPHPPRKSSALHRSNTSPAALSPRSQNFEPLRPNQEEHTIMLAPSPKFQPRITITNPGPAEGSYEALESPYSETSFEEVHDPAPLKPRLTEPKWEMVSPSKVTHDSTNNNPLNFALGPVSKWDQLKRKQSLQSSLNALTRAGAKEEAEELIRTAADVSIARQISMSREQRHLLVPIKSRSATVEQGAMAKDGEGGQGGLLVNEYKGMTPKLVHVEARRAVRSGRGVIEMI